MCVLGRKAVTPGRLMCLSGKGLEVPKFILLKLAVVK